jgi:hypothetical protein
MEKIRTAKTLHRAQFLGNTWGIASKGIGDLPTIRRRVHGQDALCRTDEVAIGVSHPELPHMPRVIGPGRRTISVRAC